MAPIECELYRVVMSEMRQHQVIILKEKGGERQLPIVIGLNEVFAIHRIINEEPPPRPLTHELFGRVLDALGARVERVVVNALEGSTFLGRLILSRNGETFDIDSRPSDAIVLAVQKGAPIYVEEQVLEATERPL